MGWNINCMFLFGRGIALLFDWQQRDHRTLHFQMLKYTENFKFGDTMRLKKGPDLFYFNVKNIF